MQRGDEQGPRLEQSTISNPRGWKTATNDELSETLLLKSPFVQRVRITSTLAQTFRFGRRRQRHSKGDSSGKSPSPVFTIPREIHSDCSPSSGSGTCATRTSRRSTVGTAPSPPQTPPIRRWSSTDTLCSPPTSETTSAVSVSLPDVCQAMHLSCLEQS